MVFLGLSYFCSLFVIFRLEFLCSVFFERNRECYFIEQVIMNHLQYCAQFVPPHGRVLDVGSGKGKFICGMAGLKYEAFGVEINPEYVTASKIRATQEGVRVSLQIGMAERLPFEDNYFAFVNCSEVGLGTALLLGLVASVSTCMAVVGGLVLSMSASFAKEGDRVRPQVLFHLGRLVAFFVLGGVIGALGGVVQLGATGTFVVSVLVALVLLVLGINLLDVFPWAKRFQLTLPAWAGTYAHSLKSVNHTLTPLLVGVATFVLPCGFTQSMQLYALSTGSFWTGASTMFAFAVGTLPVLALLSFGALGIHTKAQSGVFFKAVGLVVIFFGLLNLASALAGAGVIPPLVNF
jgi:sulfite exporter TauE/SafE